MKTLLALLLLACAPAAARAQASSPDAEAPGLAVVKFAWSKERINWERDPFSGPNESFDEMRVRLRNEKRIMDAKRGGGSQMEINKAERDARTDAALIEAIRQKAPPRYGFVYKVTVQNNGAKGIRAVDWDYVFSDAATRKELGRRQFTSEEKIGPGKKKELAFFLPSPPTQTISADTLNRKEREGLAEEVVLLRVIYEDGTVWQRP